MIPFQPPTDGEYTAVLTEGQILMTRRLQLGLTQAQVAKMAGLYVRQYQRLEIMGLSDCTMRIGLTICSVLFLNPLELVPPRVTPLHQLGLFEEPDQQRIGRKNTLRHMMQLDISSGKIIVPEQVISALGSPKHVRYHRDKARILLSAASKAASRCVFPVLYGMIIMETRYRTMARLAEESGYTPVDMPCGYTPRAIASASNTSPLPPCACC